MSAEAVKRDAVLRFACKELAASEQPKGSSKRSKLPLTKRQKELNWNSGGAEIFLDWLESIAPNENERRRFAKLREDYDLARFEKLRKSEKKRSAFAFLILWGNAVAYDREAAQAGQGVKHATVRVPLRLGFLLPFVRALNENDAEFFDGLAEAMRIQASEKSPIKANILAVSANG
jgi:hypothetical protein